ncbi:MAG: oligosaccharide flippase family protein, partial [Polyangiaceae bacterium]
MTSPDPNEPAALAPGAATVDLSAPSNDGSDDGRGGGKAPGRGVQALVFKNAALLVIAQVVAMPLSLLVNAVMARYLGAKDFGEIYLAQTFCAFGFLLVTFGQGGVLPAEVAKSLPRAGELLGTGLAWRITSGPVVYLLMAAGCYVLGYNKDFQVALALVALGNTLWVLSDACQDTVRGFERTDIAAYAVVGQQLLGGLLVVPALLLGGRVRAVLIA